MTVTSASGTARVPIGAKIVGFLRLGKIRMYHHAYGWLLAVLLLRLEGLVTERTAGGLALLLVMVLAIQFSGGAFDDLGGFRDGSDAHNYAGRPPRTVARKPLLTGVLTESEAVAFGAACWTVGVAAGLLAAYLLAAPPVAVVLLLAAQVAAAQYSVGLKLSYRPLGLELTIFFVISAIALVPYWFVAGRPSAEILLASALFGLWFLMIVNYGNASDREGDRAVSRHTLAVLLPAGWFRVLLTLLFTGSVTLLALLFTTTRIDPVLAVTVVPVVVLHAAQLYHGVRGNDWRKARFLGLSSVDAGCLGLAVAFFLAS
ncbi:1,4-dihydroxy-2-naphthoate octaprenyltransferase [Amycolatopsis arida]|uniref:1,4-dihydroxy-2-naphthoate octaprenyltransferase n=1 Tax=Amycolatopsis arida TaxID=587909 RepID=A0A1I5V7S1_9PSEU|nr:UbiA family prenyltransferase [Amycolatopsis arida]TDX91179.1 1,4-dihydroxy-2-naphthoate octaprenyltransferase [Amycolatopsis arida]SFQ03490.1 1,4-dihydroxy-2-naphthoate octaprenyltransferase [Amycolatopsis arida]